MTDWKDIADAQGEVHRLAAKFEALGADEELPPAVRDLMLSGAAHCDIISRRCQMARHYLKPSAPPEDDPVGCIPNASLDEVWHKAQEGSRPDRFETLADRFHAETGILAPGKDDPLGVHTREEREKAWHEWYAGEYYED